MDAIQEQNDVARGIKSYYFQKIVQGTFGDRMQKRLKRRQYEDAGDIGVSVTDIVYDCVRRAFLRKMLWIPTTDYEGILKTWIGSQVHAFPFQEEHELFLDWEKIFVRIDEYEDGVLVEKKSTRLTPKTARHHHRRQVDYARVIAEKNGYPVMTAAIVYINVGENVDLDVKVLKFKRNIDTVGKEMLRKRDKFVNCFKKGQIPPRQVGWPCKYDAWCNICFLDDESILKIIRTLNPERVQWQNQ